MSDGWTDVRRSAVPVSRRSAVPSASARRSVLYRTIVLLGISWLLISGLVLVSLIYLSGATARQMAPLKQHIAFYNGLYALRLAIADFEPSDRNSPVQVADWQRALDLLREFSRADAALDAATGDELLAVARHLASVAPPGSAAGPDDAMAMAAARAGLRRVLQSELAAQQALLEKLNEIEVRQWQASLALALVLVLAAALITLLFRAKARAPLNDLTYLMGLLSQKDYALALPEHTDPLLRPVFEAYNEMVERLRGFEQEHLAKEDTLRHELEQTMREVVRQQRSLARAERLAAAGDLAARVAHELRNPIAAVLVTLGNLREDVVTDDKRRRVEMMIRELQRVATVLSGLLQTANVEREPPVRFALAPVVGEVVNLLRLQLDDSVRVRYRVPDDLSCRLPEAGFRHALFDLLTNVAQAVNESGGTIDITVAQEGQALVIRIVDDGPGFPPRLVEAAATEPAATPPPGGGIGLALVRRFAHEQGGRMRLQNLEPRGALSEITIPLESCGG